MEELQLALTSARVDQRNFGLWLSNWQVGQTLNALVTAQRPSGEMVLRIGAQQITATSDIPIQQGARLLLEVKQMQPVPTLRILNPVSGPEADSIGGTLRLVAAPAQGVASSPLGRVGQALVNLASAVPAAAAIVTPLVSQLRQLARPERLAQPEGLATALRSSGLFLEANLAAGRSEQAGQDLKAGMFRALAAVEAALARVEAVKLPGADVEALLALKRDLEAGLGRLTLLQFNSVPADAPMPRQWHFELPVLFAGSFHSLQLVVEQDGRRGDERVIDQDERWTARLRVEPPALGLVDIVLALDGEAVRLRISAERAPTRSAIDAQLPRLVDAFASRGLDLRVTATAVLEVTRHDEASPAGAGLDMRA